MKYPVLLGKMLQIQINKDFAYKANFIITVLGAMIGDLVGPLLAIIIYSTTPGVPGWTLDQFLLFQGAYILVFGIGHAFCVGFFFMVYEAVERGEFDKYLLKPYNSWLYLMSMSIDWDGLPEVLFGAALSIYAMIKLDVSIMSIGFLYYLILIAAGALFQYTMFTLIAAGSFMVVKNEALLQMFFKLSDFARYPLSIYGLGLRFFLTFLFPIAVSSFYPAEALIHGISFADLMIAVLPAIAVFVLSLWVWSKTIRHYSSAGG